MYVRYQSTNRIYALLCACPHFGAILNFFGKLCFDEIRSRVT